MNWWEHVNPFTYLGNAAGKVIADGWTTAMLALWNAGLWLLKLVLGIEDAFLTPQVSQDGPMSGVYPSTFWVAAALVLVLLMVQLGVAAVRRDGQSLARVLIGAAQFGAVWVLWVGYAVAVLAAAGGLTDALMQSLLGVDALSAWQPWTGFSTSDITDGTIATVLGVMGFVLVFAAISHLLIMLARAAALLVLAATNPIAAAGLVWEGGRGWFWRSLRWFHAAAFAPVLMMLMLGVGVQVTSHVAMGYTDSLQTAVGTALPGVLLILVGCFAPLALFKMLAFVDPGTSSGAAMRAGLQAQGGVRGLLTGGGEASGDAASSSDATGRSQGEASTEAATSERLTTSAGGFISKLGGAGQALATGADFAQGLGTRAGAVGADITNQMGVGHNTYLPDTPSSQSNSGGKGRGGQRGGRGGPGPDPDDVPNINGAGPNPAGPAGMDTPAAGGGGSGSAAGSAAAGGQAASVPIVPV